MPRKPAAKNVGSLSPGTNLEMAIATMPLFRNHCSLRKIRSSHRDPDLRKRKAAGRPPNLAIA